MFIVDFTAIAHVMALPAIAALLVLWAIKSRTLLGLFYTVGAGLIIFAGLYSDGQPGTLARILIGGPLLMVILRLAYKWWAKRRAKVKFYIPLEQRQKGQKAYQ